MHSQVTGSLPNNKERPDDIAVRPFFFEMEEHLYPRMFRNGLFRGSNYHLIGYTVRCVRNTVR